MYLEGSVLIGLSLAQHKGSYEISITGYDEFTGEASAVLEIVVSDSDELALNATNINSDFDYVEDSAKKLSQISITANSEPIEITLTLDNPNAGEFNTESISNSTSTFESGVYEVSGNLNDVNSILENLYFIPAEDFNEDFSIQVYIINFLNNFITGTIKAHGSALPDPPVNLLLSNNQVDKTASIGTVIGSFTATDPDENQTLSFYLAEGSGDNHNNYFQISGNQLILKELLDSVNIYYEIRVGVVDSDNLFNEQNFIIETDDDTIIFVDENMAIGSVIGTLNT